MLKVLVLLRIYLQWLFALEICCGYLPWELATAVCRGDLSQLFAVAFCCGNLPQLFAVGLFVYGNKPFFCMREFLFFFVNKLFLIERKPFLYESKTSFMGISFLTVFLFVIAVAVMGHRA